MWEVFGGLIMFGVVLLVVVPLFAILLVEGI
jgi:hypothetical protein